MAQGVISRPKSVEAHPSPLPGWAKTAIRSLAAIMVIALFGGAVALFVAFILKGLFVVIPWLF